MPFDPSSAESRPARNAGFKPPRVLIGLVMFALMGLVHAGNGVVGPWDDWCDRINAAAPGDQVLLRPGLYEGPCIIRAQGTADGVIRIRSLDPDQPAQIRSRRVRKDMLVVRGGRHLAFSELEFVTSAPWSDAIRVDSGESILIESNRFSGLRGHAVLAASGDTDGLVIRDNRIIDNDSTAIYLGCHKGTRCRSTNVLVESNLIRGAYPDDPQVGYGIQFKLNTTGIIRGNTISHTKGPGIMVYGSDAGGQLSLIEGNSVSHSWRSDGITVGGGPAPVTGNTLHSNAGSGVYAQDYGERGLQHRVRIEGNHIWDNLIAGITLEAWQPGVGNAVLGNRIGSFVDTPAILTAVKPFPAHGQIRENVPCQPGCCRALRPVD